MKIYMENKARIAKHNQKASKGEESFFMKMNHFGDKLHHEVVSTLNGYKKGLKSKSKKILRASFMSPVNANVPDTVDWRDKGAVTPIKDQGQCGSCWAFSATGSLEGQHFRQTGTLVSLSEQNLVDCSRSYGNNGCEGGLMDFAFDYIKDNRGIDTEDSYPYEAEDDQCRFSRKNVGATDVGFVDIPENNEEKLKEAVATIGPVSVAIDASHSSFQFYSHGVYAEPACDPNELDHGVLAVGYGTENGKDYWLVKNSWGTVWGDDGYVKIARNQRNMCGIAASASYPLV